MEDLNDILNPPQQDEVANEVGGEQEQEQQEVATGAAETQVAAETQQAVKEEKQEDPAAALRAEIAAEKAALAKERERVRAKAAELEAKLAQPQPEPQKAPDFWEDPEARLAAERQQFEARLQQQDVRLQQQRLEFSEMLAREKHADFNEKLEVFGGLVRENPALYQQMLKEANPAGWAYEQAAKHLRVKQLEEIGDPQEYENKLKEKFRQEWEAIRAAEAERQKAAEVEATIAKKLPKSGFSELRSVGGSRDKAWSGPTPIGAIIGGGKK